MRRALNSFDDVEKVLRPYIPLVKELTGKDTVLERILPLMTYLGNPQDKLKTIHLAGTSGKTSTSYYIAALLNQAGLNVGLTVSPHIDKLSERTQINGKPLEDHLFFKELGIFLELVESSQQLKPSYFELIYAFSIWLFAKYDVDCAVIETGLGGLFDATNVVSREDKVCVLTDIGFDHMNILGNTIEEIAAQKVGIVHEHNPLLMYKQSDNVMFVIEKWVKEHKAPMHLTDETSQAAKYGKGEAYTALADFQKRNWLLAYYVYRFVAERDNLEQLGPEQLKASQQIVIPARMDIVNINGKHLVMDGAHNLQKMSAFIDSYKKKFAGAKPAVLIAFRTGKDYEHVLPLIKELASEVIVTTFNTSQDLPIVSIPAKKIYDEFITIGTKNLSMEANNSKALKKLLATKYNDLIITGSFYLISQLRGEIFRK